MDRRLRRAPDAEWVLMYRLGLSRQRIADLVRAEPATVGYHLVIARRQDPGLEPAHHAAAAGAKPALSPTDLARMDEITAWITAEGRFPRDRSEDKGERSMARWLSERRREATDGILDPAYRDGLAQVPGWEENPRAAADEARWHDRLAQLADFRAEGNDWPPPPPLHLRTGTHPRGVDPHPAIQTPPRRPRPWEGQASGRRRSRLADRADPGPPAPPVTAGSAPCRQTHP
ncbi:helicase associated domain-containing protein [Arthrobacter sp. UYCu723]